MKLFLYLFFSVLFYSLLFYSPIACRISDKRKCSNADCSEPISLATTLLRYNADDERLLSFPRNVKLKVYSKEAGHTPNFWEVEINGKRGYVPKGLLREDKVLVPSNKLTFIVPTGRIDTPVQNASKENLDNQESKSVNMLSATPELPLANSKGLFSTIGGVSADSVPMNLPDIKPQSTRKFQVFDGTTVYDDVVSEKPESPPTIIDDPPNENQKSKKESPSDSNEIPHDSNVPSPDIKPVREIINENEKTIETEQKGGIENEVDRPTEEEVGLKEGMSDDKGNQVEEGASELPIDKRNQTEEAVPESPSETNILDNIVNKVTNMFPSGAGEDITEEGEEEEEEEEVVEDNEEGSAEEEVEENEEIIKSKGTTGKEPGAPDGQTLDVSEMNTSEAPNLINILDKHESNMKPDELKFERHYISNQETVQDEVLSGEGENKTVEDFKVSSSEIKEDIAEHHESKPEKMEEIIKPTTGDDKPETVSKQGLDLQPEKNIQLPETEISTSYSDVTFEQSPQQNKAEASQELPNEEEAKNNKSFEKETTVELTGDLLDKDPEPQALDSKKPHVEDEPKTNESEEMLEADPNVQEQSETEEQQVKEQLKTEELHVQGEPESITEPSPIEPTARQVLFGSYQSGEVSPEKDTYETSETTSSPEGHVSTKVQDDVYNDTAHLDNLSSPDTGYSSLPTLEPFASPKYSSVISKRIQNSDSAVDDISPDSQEDEESESQPQINDTTERTLIHEETSPSLLRQSQSPKYSSVVSQRVGSFAPLDDVDSEVAPETKTEHPDSDIEGYKADENSADVSVTEIIQAGIKSAEEIEYAEAVVGNSEMHSNPPLSDFVAPADVDHENLAEKTSEEEMFSWATSFFDVLWDKGASSIGESPAISGNLDPSQTTHFPDETCSADGIEGSCHTLRETMEKEVTWQESSYTSDMWELMEKVPLEATIWLVITAVVVLIFSLGHYYIEAHRRDGPLVAIINKLEREVLILKKESCILEDRLQIAHQQLEAWNTSSSENDALLVELKQELEETRAAKAELEEQAAQLKEELETVTESGLEMHRLLEESLSSQDGSQVLLSTVETLREKLQRQEEEISGLSDTLSSKNTEVEELQGKLAQAAEVARSLEDKVIAVSREKEEELLTLRDKHRELILQLEEVMENKALEETRLSTEMSKLRLTIEELQKTLADKDSELETLKEVVKQLRATDSNEKIEALFDVVGVQAKLKTAVAERDEFREKFLEEEGARKLLEGHMKKITQEVADLKNSFETAEKEKIEALTKLQVLSNYFKEKESQLQKELGLQESMWLQKQSDDHTIYEQMRSLREENEKFKLQNESLKKEIVEQEASFKIQLANTEQKAHENWVASRQAERKLKEAQQEAAQLRNRLTTVEKNTANYSLDEKPNISESNGDPSSPPPSLMFPPTTSPPFMMYGPPPGDFVPPPPFMSSPYPSDSRPPPLGRISSPPLDHRFSPPPPLPYPPYDYPPYGHHSPSPPPPLAAHHRNVHKPQPREIPREQKDHVPNYSPEAEKTSRRNKR